MVPRGGPQRHDGPVTLTSDGPAVNFANVDYALEYSADGSLLHSYDHAALTRLDNQQRYAIFDATLQTALDSLTRNPKSFEDLLHAGTAFLDWGFYDEAQRYLQNAKFASSATNPYPFFFLGQLAEAQHHPEIVRAYYSKAVELDSTPPNPAFANALARLHQ